MAAMPSLAPLAAAEGGGERILSWPGAASERPFRYASSSPDGLSNHRADRALYRRLFLTPVREDPVGEGEGVGGAFIKHHPPERKNAEKNKEQRGEGGFGVYHEPHNTALD